MATVALVAHPRRREATELARAAGSWLHEHGHDAVAVDGDGVPTVPDGVDYVVSLGGDGTMLRAVDLVAARGIPVLGVNVGHLGYLTDVEPAGLEAALARLVAGDFELDERMTLRVEVARADGPTAFSALNEAVLEKTESGHTVRLAVSINDRFFTTYAADGLIVATPTGSTAYNFSARGPIVSPRQQALVVTPVSPHMLFGWSLVLDATEHVRVELVDGRAAALVVDGRTAGVLGEGDAVVYRRGDHPARLVSLDGRDFHQLLKTKFGLPDR